MKYYAVDIETFDPLLKTGGESYLFNQGRVLCTGLYSAKNDATTVFVGGGGKKIKNILSCPDSTIIGANITYDIGWLLSEHNMDISQLKCSLVCVQVAESFIDEYQPYSLDSLARKYLHVGKGSNILPELCEQNGLKGDFRQHLSTLWDKGYSTEIMEYCKSDTRQAYDIWKAQNALVSKAEDGMIEKSVFDSTCAMNFHLLKVTLGMKIKGVRFDYEKWEKNCAICEKAVEELQNEFYEKYEKINVNSPKQVATLFDKFNIPYTCNITVKGYKVQGRKFSKADCVSGNGVWELRGELSKKYPSIKVKKGKIIIPVQAQYAQRTASEISGAGYEIIVSPAMGKDTFTEFASTYPVAFDIQDVKQALSVKSKFLGEGLKKHIMYHESEGEYRIHGKIDVCGARATSRMSSSKINLQSIPSKTVLFAGTEKEVNLAEMCRELFLPEKGEMFVKLDYSGQENILMAHFAPGVSGEFIKNKYRENSRFDEHQYVADVSGLEAQHGKKIGRKLAKNVRFGITYGMRIRTMMQHFGWDKEFATTLYDDVSNNMSWVMDTINIINDRLQGKNKYRGRQKLYIKTLLGRVSHLRKDYMNESYKFYNRLIQGSAADMLKLALYNITQTKGVETLLLLVHDEACFSVPMTPDGFQRVAQIQQIMETASALSIKVHCEPEAGKNWWHTEGKIVSEQGVYEDTVDFCYRIADKIQRGDEFTVDMDDIDTVLVVEDANGDEEEDEDEE